MSFLRNCLCIAVLVAAAFSTPMSAAPQNAGALVLVNSTSPHFPEYQARLEPYLSHFGVPCEVRDISVTPAGADAAGYAVIIVGHRGLDAPRRFLSAEVEKEIMAAVKGGTGLVSFDGLLASWSREQPAPIYSYASEVFGVEFTKAVSAASIVVGGPAEHFITNLRPAPRTIELKQPMLVPGLRVPGRVQVLAKAGDAPLVLAAQHGSGRAVLFATDEWASPHVKGKLYGLDDLVWRSIVWAARKPFVMRGMPKFLAFRVDDVAGFGIGSNRNLGWVDVSNRYGLIPWLGVFMDDFRDNPVATGRLAELTQKGLATATVHARRWPNFFYVDEPLRTDEAQRNILGKPFPEAVVEANFKEADAFFAQHRIVSKNLVLPHFYQAQPNVFPHLKARAVEFVGTILRPGDGYGSPVPRFAPYLSTEPVRASNATDPIYIADWISVPGHPELDRTFFNFIVEIRDIAGYEWAPSGVPVEEAIRRGVEQTRREFDSLVPGVLFTHESDHIQHITPENWDRILKEVMAQLGSEKPIMAPFEAVAQYVRATRTSTLATATWDPSAKSGRVTFTGTTDIPTRFYVWQEGSAGPVAEEHEAPSFKSRGTANWK